MGTTPTTGLCEPPQPVIRNAQTNACNTLHATFVIMSFVKAGPAAAVPPGSVAEVELADRPYAVCNVDGDIFAIGWHLPRAGGRLGTARCTATLLLVRGMGGSSTAALAPTIPPLSLGRDVPLASGRRHYLYRRQCLTSRSRNHRSRDLAPRLERRSIRDVQFYAKQPLRHAGNTPPEFLIGRRIERVERRGSSSSSCSTAATLSSTSA